MEIHPTSLAVARCLYINNKTDRVAAGEELCSVSQSMNVSRRCGSWR